MNPGRWSRRLASREMPQRLLTHRNQVSLMFVWLTLVCLTSAAPTASGASALEVGLAVRDVTPSEPIWMGGYAARKHPSERVDTPLLAQACAFRSESERVVLVALDNCEVSGDFTAPVLRTLQQRHSLKPGSVMIVSSHTHAGPVVEGPLLPMYPVDDAQRNVLHRYGEKLKTALTEVVDAALHDLKPARLEHGVGKATFAINRRSFRENAVAIGENLAGPTDWEVPVLRIKGTNDQVRAVLFGYACHATSIQGDDFYVVSGDYIAYARQSLEALYPGAVALFLTGMGADQNPYPRGSLLASKRHGIQLAGAIVSVLSRPMRPVEGAAKLAYAEVDLPLADPPSAEALRKDAEGQDVYIRNRALAYLERQKKGQTLPNSVRLPVAVLRIGGDLTLVAVAGEVVVDYALRLKRELPNDHLWTVGYAYEVPCYIPSERVLREGGYEGDSSMIYYGLYGPFKPAVESLVVNKVTELVAGLR